ncbi:MAG: hypothetical protein A3G27_15865 [Betaproteobacteria bacterium RIFCSPLOWO2_12_FULL_66_14]|nr:MAG: hypothetical protein A3G27_15865 [Betaproteobacteria bacterium RIFCSPLOWO2_12_FULL_66_14]
MRRGDIHFVAAPGYFGKVRPAVVVQSAKYLQNPPSVTVCLITGTAPGRPAFRVLLPASQGTGLTKSSEVMIDKVMSLPTDRVKNRIGAVSAEDLKRIDEALRDWQGL